jgi:hypothetical protein
MAQKENNNEREMRLTTKTKLQKQRRKRHVRKHFPAKFRNFAFILINNKTTASRF